MKKICYLLIITVIIITSCKTKNQNAGQEGPSSKESGVSVEYNIPAPAIPFTAEQNSWVSKAHRHEKNGWLYLHIEGTPKERGFQHGYLLANEIEESIRVLSESWKYQSALDWESC
jgi:hypothetical protein